MATNKSKNWLALGLHIGLYCLVLFFGVSLFARWFTVPIFVGVNGLAHFVTDSVTSRMTTRCWENNNTYGFFTTIGFDQWLHATTLILTTEWILR